MRSLFIVLLSQLALLCTAQNNPPAQLQFNHLFVKDGLIEGRVHPIIQDNQGYMWMGTHNGLVRYDGYQPKTYLLSGKKLNRTRISDIYVDTKGELWVGTYSNGLYKYDRPNDTFILCTPDTINEHFLQAGSIYNLINDRLGNLWFVLHEGLTGAESVFSFDARHQRFTHYSNEEKGRHRTTYSIYFSPLIKDNNGNIWCGSDNGLKEYDYSRDRFIEHFTTNNRLLHKDFSMVCIDKLNPHILWIAIWNDHTDKFESLGRYNTDNDSLTIYQHLQYAAISLSDDYIYNINCDSKGNIWVVTQTALIFFDVASKRFINYIPPSSAPGLKNIYGFKEDPYGNFWCLVNGGSVEGKLAYFNTITRHFTIYTSKSTDDESLQSPHDLYLDHSGTLWISEGNRGVQWVNKEKSKLTPHIVTTDKKRDKQVLFNDCAEAPDHTIWFATDSGLCHWNPAKNSFEGGVSGKKSGPNSLVSAILIDKKGCVWYGNNTLNYQGLCCYNPVTKKIKTYTYHEEDTTSLSSNRIAALWEDASGYIWIGTYEGGLCRFDQATKKFTRYPHISNVERTPKDNRLDDNDVQCLYKDKDGILWVGTIWGSINKINKESGTFTSFGDKVPLLKGVLSIYEDSRHDLCIGTFTDGLFLIDRKKETVRRISEKDGLLYNEIEGILEDNRGNIWLKSVRGISIYNLQTSSVRNINNELLENDMPNHLSYKISGGLFIFSTGGGFVTLNPNDFTPDSIVPVVHLETVVVNKPQAKKVVDSTILLYSKSSIHLKYNENRITFNYVGLLYQNTSQIQYKYKLDGYDNHLVNAKTQRSVTYTNLAPGTYTFHVLAANSDGVWSRQDDAITVIIAPPFWETWWFRALVILSITETIYLVVKSYLKRKLKAQQQEFERQKAIEKVRSKISMDIHDEISSGLTKISLLSQRVKSKYERSKEVEPEIIDKIAGSSKEVISNLGEIIWAVNPKHDNLQSLLAYIRNYIFNFFEATTIEVHINFPEEVPPAPVSPDIKRNLFLVVKEALNNILKHAAATQAAIYFKYSDDDYTLTIKDNGRGMEQLNGRAFGNGLTNMKKRMELIGGSLTIHSEKNKGTQLQFKGRFRVETEA